jgi:hypothetical protein
MSHPPLRNIRTHYPSIGADEVSTCPRLSRHYDRRTCTLADRSASDIFTKNVAKRYKRQTYAGKLEAAECGCK